jgi:hypothetical protein
MSIEESEPGAPLPAKPGVATTIEELKHALAAAQNLLASAPERVGPYRDMHVFLTDALRAVDARILELSTHPDITADQLDSVCVLLGPYRNLTTLTCSVLSLHRQCIVLNHAGVRTLSNPRLNFFWNYTPEKFDDFVRYAVYASRGGARGTYGGSIRLSHGFDAEEMQQAAARLQSSTRGRTKSLVWKDSHLVTNFLRSQRIDVAQLLERNTKLRFLLPVRNPVDCAMSNLRTGHIGFFRTAHGLSAESPVEDVVAAVLDEITWFLDLRERSGHADRFFLYFEHEIGKEVLRRMLAFLGLSPNETYLAAAAEAFKVSPAEYDTKPFLESYAGQVKRKFERYPEVRDALLRFADR